VARLLEALRGDAATAALGRAAGEHEATSRQSSDLRARMSRMLSRSAAGRSELVQQLLDAAERMGPQPGESGARLAAIVAPRVTPAPMR
jgi:hypothetical protein